MSATQDTRPLLRPADVARQLNVSRKTAYRLIDRGELRAIPVGRALRIEPAEVDSYLAREIR